MRGKGYIFIYYVFYQLRNSINTFILTYILYARISTEIDISNDMKSILKDGNILTPSEIDVKVAYMRP